MAKSLNLAWDPHEMLTLGDLRRFITQAQAAGVSDGALLVPCGGAQDYGFCGFAVAIPRSSALRLSQLVRSGVLPVPVSGGSQRGVAPVWRP